VDREWRKIHWARKDFGEARYYCRRGEKKELNGPKRVTGLPYDGKPENETLNPCVQAVREKKGTAKKARPQPSPSVDRGSGPPRKRSRLKTPKTDPSSQKAGKHHQFGGTPFKPLNKASKKKKPRSSN